DFHETQETSRAELEILILQTQVAAEAIAHQLESGRDRLLELNSFRPEVADRIIREIRQADRDRSLEEFMLAVFEQFNIQVEEVAARTARPAPAGGCAPAFPVLPRAGMGSPVHRP